MSTTVVGILGVIAGALTTSGTQIWITSRQRHNDALAAARITWGSLAEVISVIEGSVKIGTWTVGAAGIERQLVLWEENRTAMARSVNDFGFRTIDLAFSRLRQTLEQAGSLDTDDGLAAVVADPEFQGDLATLREARSVAMRAGQSTWDRVRYPRKRKSWEARMGAAIASAEAHVPIAQVDEADPTREQCD